MCGFSGIVDFKSSQNSELEQCLRAMNKTLSHRGPDDHGYFLASFEDSSSFARFSDNHPRPASSKSSEFNLGFGHQRLSIIDLSSAGAQPMSSANHRLWIVYNGEIFNFVEIREELKAQGVVFQSQSDTEVILHAYERWGKDCLERFNGMWAFAIFDRQKKEIFCARDRFGIKPFYYYLDSRYFIFASELKAILQHPHVRKAPNDRMVFDFLIYGYQDHTEETLFHNLKQLMPAHHMTIDRQGKPVIKRWWDIRVAQDKQSDSHTLNFDESADTFRDLFEDSVRIRLRSDVPVGISLSGGLDSSAIAQVVTNLGRKKSDARNIYRSLTFSACYEEAGFDDRAFVEEALKTLDAESFYIFPKAQDLWDEIEKMTWIMDEPFHSSNQFAQWSVMKLAAQHKIKVLLSGQGSDEYLAGYRGYNSVWLAELLKRGSWNQAFEEMNQICAHQDGIKKTSLFLRVLFGIMPRMFLNLVQPVERLIGKTPKGHDVSLFNPDFVNRFAGQHQAYWQNRHKELAHLNQKLYRDVFQYSLPLLLHYEDRNGMAFSIEARYPFLDHRLLEFAFSLPPELKIHEGRNKWMLRKSMQGILPERIRDRKDKKGFVTPETAWLQNGLDKIKPLFKDSKLKSNAYTNVKKVFNHLDKMGANARYSHQTDLWRVINLEIWLQKFF